MLGVAWACCSWTYEPRCQSEFAPDSTPPVRDTSIHMPPGSEHGRMLEPVPGWFWLASLGRDEWRVVGPVVMLPSVGWPAAEAVWPAITSRPMSSALRGRDVWNAARLHRAY